MASAPPSGSRLQKLLKLIDGGSSLATRKAAAAQIAGIAAAHPAQLPAVLAAVSRHLRHHEWDARVAAGHCLGLLAERFQHHTPADLAAAAASGADVATAVLEATAAASVKTEQGIKTEDGMEVVEAAEGSVSIGGAAGAASPAPAAPEHHLLSFSNFDVQQVLAQGTPMLASGGEEYEMPVESGLNRTEQLRRQRGNLKQRLGLGGPLMDGVMDTDEMFGDEDLLTEDSKGGRGAAGGSESSAAGGRGQKQAGKAAAGAGKGAPATEHKDASQLLADMSGMSARERAAAARRAKALKRTASSAVGPSGAGGGSKRAKSSGAGGGKAGSEVSGSEAAGGSGGGDAELEGSAAELAEQEWADVLQGGRWPFQSLCDQLCLDILHPHWEVRHGAALALREVLRSQAGAAGVVAAPAAVPSGWSAAGGEGKLALGPVSAADAAAAAVANAGWLEDCAIHLLCVLALDRFGDFVSDQVVAPVRETAAQALGAAARPLSPVSLPALLGALRQLSEHGGEWEVRHGGLLGLKYVLAARAEGVDATLLEAVLPAAIVGLQDPDDDVQAVAAEALLPAAGLLAAADAPPGTLMVRQLLWDALLELEDLSPATGSVMELLAHIHSCPGAAAIGPPAAAGSEAGGVAGSAAGNAAGEVAQLGQLVPRLWPFLRHGLTSVRHATLRCLSALLRSQPVGVLLPGQELHRALRLLFQCLLLERTVEVLSAAQAAWQLLVQRAAPDELTAALPAQPALEALFRLAATPAHSSLDASLMLSVPLPRKRGGGAGGGSSKAALAGRGGAQQQIQGTAAAAAAEQQQQEARRRESLVVEADGDAARTTRMRLAAARALGQLACQLSASSACVSSGSPHPAQAPVEALLRGGTATGRLLASFAVAHWAQLLADAGSEAAAPAADPCLQQLLAVLLELLAVPAAAAAQSYAELAQLYAQLRNQASGLILRALQANVALAMPAPLESLGHQGALALVAQVPAAGVPAELALAQQALSATAGLLQATEALLHTSVSAGLAVAAVQVASLPPKLNTIIQPLVAAIRREPQAALQDAAAEGLARLTLLCVERTPCPNEKIIKNMCGFACGDPRAVPSVAAPPDLQAELDKAEAAANGGGRNGGGDGRGGRQAAPTPQEQQEELAAQALALARRGGEAVLQAMARQAGPQLHQRLPKLWEQAAAPLAAVAQLQQQAGGAGAAAGVDLQAAVNALHVLAVLAPAVHAELSEQLAQLLPLVVLCLQHPNSAIQLAAAQCVAALAQAHTAALMPLVLRLLAPLLAGGAPDAARLGALLALHHTVGSLGLSLVPFSLLVVVPLMGRMSDAQPVARALAARTFATVVALMPLAQGAEEPAALDDAQRVLLASEGRFLQQLLDNSSMDDYVLPININGTLRRYQQEGINWLAFLRRFGLHGVLADDMGLGKTLQTTAILAAHTHEQRLKFAQTGAPADRPLPSLVVCPSTLVAHWPFEISKFVAPDVLRPLAYHGTPAERAALRRQLSAHDVLVMSYESLRADADWVASQAWSYCVLDEGHAIRNPASKISLAAKRAGLAARHRLLLSGTPVQNSVVELWSLFDFLMPGLLGSERQFNSKYRRTMQAARTSKRGSAEAEAGLLAVEGLHRQVMPFVLRRTKDAVLADLPPKIVQDLVVEPSPLQRELYQEFQNSQALAQITGLVGSGGLSGGGEGGSGAAPPAHVFQSLIYLRKLCSHPLLVLDPAVPQHMQAVRKVLGAKHGADWGAAQAALAANLAHAPKLAALQELLLDAGIGNEPGSGGAKREEEDEMEGGMGGSSAGHRVLVFAQLKGLLDLVESQVLGPLGVSSLRIDGSVDAAERFRRVQRFNADPTIDVMLLTTAVGGLGLNLTAADTVVFLEHDWNPMADLQAMDRAHRLGQQRTVNVYRLLVRGTLEEQIMSLQRFKLDVAATLANQENMSLTAMDTGNLLDIFTLQDGGSAAGAAGTAGGQQPGPGGEGGEAAAATAAAGSKKGALSAVLAGLGSLEASEAQYADEFNLQAFQKKLAQQQQQQQ